MVTPPHTTNRRQKPPRNDRDLYSLSRIQTLVTQDRRHDERGRLKEVQQQSQTWQYTVMLCIFLNIAFIIFAYLGWLHD